MPKRYLTNVRNTTCFALLVVSLIASPFGVQADTDGERADEWESDTRALLDTEAPAERAETNKRAPQPTAPDPSLLRLKADLTALCRGEIPTGGNLSALFTVRLDIPSEVVERLSQLPAEIARIETQLSEIRSREETVETDEPTVPRPAALDTPLSPPTPPTPPTPPEKPPRGSTAADFGGISPKLYYKKALAEFETQTAAFKEAETAYAARQAAYETAVSTRAEEQAAFESAQNERAMRIAAQRRSLKSDATDAKIRLTVARLRQRYLTALSELLERFPAPALSAFQSLDENRAALRSRAAQLRALSASAKKLLDRMTRLRDRAAAGALLGFQVQRDDLATALSGDIRGLAERIARADEPAERLLRTADAIETEGRETKQRILAAALRPERDAYFDALFEEALRRSRKSADLGGGALLSDADISAARAALDESISSPDALATTADAETATTAARSAMEQLDRVLSFVPSSVDRHLQAFAREQVAVFSGQASDGAKSSAYSLSSTLLEDLKADLAMLGTELSLWLESRLTAIRQLPDSAGREGERVRIVRIFGGLLLALLLLVLRRPIRKKLSALMIRAARRRASRRAVGTLARLTVFLAALVPTLIAAAAGYTLLLFWGFDSPEVRMTEVALRWTVLYLLVRQIVRGLTRRERRGRPPLIEMRPENAALLAKTYARLGLFLALMAAVHEWTVDWLGTGSLSLLVRLVAGAWAAGWTAWALFAWHKPLARSCADISPEGSRRRAFAERVGAHAVGVLAAPLLLVWRVPLALFTGLKRLLAEGGLLGYFRARALRRMSRKTQSEAPGPTTTALPEPYTRHFPLYPLQGEEGEVLLPRKASLAAAREQIERWRTAKQDGSLAVIGEKGMGKTTFLALLQNELNGEIETVRHTLAKKMRSQEMLLEDLGAAFGVEKPKSTGALAHFLNDGPERVVLLDEAHNVFLRTVGGFAPVDTLVSLVDFTSEKVFWVCVFNKYAWRFLTKADPRVRSFRKQLRLPAWSQAEIQELIASRNRRSGIAVEFDEVLLDETGGETDGFELINSADGFFRLLYETSRGNPRTATYLWLNSLSRLSDRRLRAGLIREEPLDTVAKLGDERLFALAAVAQHENLSFNELRQALNVSLDEAAQTGRYLLENGILEPKHSDPARMTLAPRFHHQVLRVLRDKNLLYTEE